MCSVSLLKAFDVCVCICVCVYVCMRVIVCAMYEHEINSFCLPARVADAKGIVYPGYVLSVHSAKHALKGTRTGGVLLGKTWPRKV